MHSESPAAPRRCPSQTAAVPRSCPSQPPAVPRSRIGLTAAGQQASQGRLGIQQRHSRRALPCSSWRQLWPIAGMGAATVGVWAPDLQQHQHSMRQPLWQPQRPISLWTWTALPQRQHCSCQPAGRPWTWILMQRSSQQWRHHHSPCRLSSRRCQLLSGMSSWSGLTPTQPSACSRAELP